MRRIPMIAVAIVAILAGAGQPVEAGKKNNKSKKKQEVVATVVVQHILISFKGRNPKKKDILRSKKQAEKLALELLERAQKGEDFDALVEEYTDDKHPGIYTMSNKGLGKPPGGVNRADMVPEFGDVAFDLGVGEIGMAYYSVGGSPYGFHIIKRLE